MSNPRFTVFTPTYNRRHLLHRPFDSLNSQSCRDFEWVVYDDGSTDGTEEYICDVIGSVGFPISYVRKGNGGKARAINAGLDMARGEWFVVLDSDDWCDENALQRLSDEIDLLEARVDKEIYGAISVLKRYADGRVVGDDYGNLQKYGLSYIDRMNLGVRGDKWEVIRTDVHKKYRYDLAPGERYMAPSYAWIRLAIRYKSVFVNEPLSTIEYQDDGISANNIKHRLGSRHSSLRYYRFAVGVACSSKAKLRMEANLVRFSLHCGERSSARVVPRLVGSLLYLRDKFLAR